MPESRKVDVVVIGAGQSGGPLAGAMARAGRKVALIEREHVGGTCINTGCTPTKTMVASARVAYLVNRASDYGVQTPGNATVNLSKVRQRKRDIVKMFRDGSQRRLESTDGLELLFGEASFKGPKTVQVELKEGGGIELSAEIIVLNTGARTNRPPIDGLEKVSTLDNTSIMELDEVPEHLLVMGGGYIGLEFGQMFRRFGSEVTILQKRNQLLTREDEDVADEVAKIFREDGIQLLLDSTVDRVAEADGGIELTVNGKHGQQSVKGSHLLVATGRTPNTDRLNLAAAGIETDDRGFIKVNDRLETSANGIFAMGDVKGGPAFTHISYDDFRVIRTNLLEGGSADISNRLVPYTVFIDPQLGRVGLTERQAREQKANIKVAKLPMEYAARALETDETRGFMKAVINADTGQILGVAILGIEGGEVMTVLQMAMMGGVPYTRIRDGVFAHPTLSESLNNLFQKLD